MKKILFITHKELWETGKRTVVDDYIIYSEVSYDSCHDIKSILESLRKDIQNVEEIIIYVGGRKIEGVKQLLMLLNEFPGKTIKLLVCACSNKSIEETAKTIGASIITVECGGPYTIEEIKNISKNRQLPKI
ncbi:MAG: hypothetical protein V1707_03465 [bacterium]